MSDNNSFSVHPTRCSLYMKSTKLSVLSGINRNKHEQGEEVGMIIMMTMIMMDIYG
jgi:hypothetical protein